MLHDSTTPTPRRIDISTTESHAATAARVFAQSNTIDISKFIALMDDEGVTVAGGEPQLDLTSLAAYDESVKRCWTQPGFGPGGVLGGPGYGKSFTYEIKAPTFSATVKYAKNNNGRHIELLTIVHPGKASGMVVYGRQIRSEQGDAVLNKCDIIMADCRSKAHREQQEKFDTFMTTLDVTPKE